ncbi:MAG: hypothetical protein IJY84_00620 [Clostridia bacterium]|nr:hypothetical protein [Clostridia bacterium]
MIDIHCHALPFVDDGSESFEQTLAMLKEEIKQGVKGVVLTPHYRKHFFTQSDEKVRAVFEELCDRVKAEGLDIDLYLGREITVYKGISETFDKGEFIPMSNGKFVLLEFPYEKDTDIEEVCYRVRLSGYLPIVAHIERYSYFRSVESVERLRASGVVIQVNATSVAQKSYNEENKFVKELLKRKLVDVVASDYHFNRENFMAQAYARVKSKYGEDYANLIFSQNPNYVATISKR